MNTKFFPRLSLNKCAFEHSVAFKAFYTILLLIVTFTISAQVPSIEWTSSYGGSSDDFGRSIELTSTGNYIIAGGAKSNNIDVTGHHGTTEFEDYWLINITSTGDLVWQKSYGGSNLEFAQDIHQTADGGYIVAGSSASTDGNVDDPNGYYDFWVLKLNPAGGIIWKTNLGGLYGDLLLDIIETTDGGFMAIGYARSTDGDVTSGHGLEDIWVVNLDADGNLIWQKTYGGSGEDYGHGIVACAEGGYLLSGYTKSNDGDVSFNHGFFDVWIIKIDTAGVIEWEKTFGGNNNETNASLIQDEDGNYLVCNSTLSNNEDVSGHHAPGTFYDYWIIKISPVGELLWQKCLGGINGDYSSNAIQTPDKGYLILGYSASYDGDVTGHHGVLYSNDYWLVKIDANGIIQWQKSLGGSDWDSGYDLALTVDGGIIVIGFASSSDFDVTTNIGGYDYWVVKLQCTDNYFYADLDADGYGNADAPIAACFAPSGYIIDSTDCDDGDALLNPAAIELCNDVDDNCNGLADEGLLFVNYFADADGDGFGNPTVDSNACSIVPGYILDNTDCDDSNFIIHPTAPELCNGIDENCNLIIDDGIDFYTFYADLDEDDYGDFTNDTTSCDIVAGYIADFSDCDDTNPTIHPLATELCNGLDDNCNTLIDDDIIFITYYLDADTDSYGDFTIDSSNCFMPVGYVNNNTDCDDFNNAINPAALEICNHFDDNCNLLIDDGLTANTYYQDFDGDTFGNVEIDSADCMAVSGYTIDSTDCDDNNAEIYPGAAETLNGVDDNCNQLIDEGLVDIIADAEKLVVVYPNPSNGMFEINFPESSTPATKIIMINSLGQTVYAQELIAHLMHNSYLVNAPNLIPGCYLVIVFADSIKIGNAYIQVQ